MDYKNIYPHSIDVARENSELELYHESNDVNIACAKAIYKAILDNNYEPNYYAFDKASKTVIDEYGVERVSWVLASTVQHSFGDGRYSSANKSWAKGFDIPNQRHNGFTVGTHPHILDGFIEQVRKNHVEMLTEAIGQYEKRRRISERNRLTWFHNDIGVFVANPGITQERLIARYNEIMEKKTKF